jgi:Mannosyl-glycoprotein endo-beta-N-acetylglucosaminidase
MNRFIGASLAIALAAVAIVPAAAADLPEVKVSASNPVPACATPGRLMAYLRSRNPRIDDRYDDLATAYMRIGEELGIRWDVAFFQMILETGALSYTGDVRANQNNFAGLGASGGGRHGERFADISSGVKAHLQHLLMYAGEHIDNPVAERTRKVQEWGVLTDWQRSITGPMTFALVAQQWAPGSRGYVRDIAAISDGFYDDVCNAPDPQPGLVQEARKGRTPQTEAQVAELAPADTDAPAEVTGAIEPAATTGPSGEDIAQRSIEQARKEDPPRTALGAGMLGSVAESAKATTVPPAAKSQIPPAATKSQTPPAVTLINPSTSKEAESKTAKAPPAAKADTAKAASKSEPQKTADTKAETPKSETIKVDTAKADAAKIDPAKADTAKGAAIQTASVAGGATQLNVPPAAKGPAKCKVWTASYGGQRAILIKATTDGMVNYTVLDVNESSEKREVDAYIAAYAKGGEKVDAFPNQTQALDKAFRLCPEG